MDVNYHSCPVALFTGKPVIHHYNVINEPLGNNTATVYSYYSTERKQISVMHPSSIIYNVVEAVNEQNLSQPQDLETTLKCVFRPKSIQVMQNRYALEYADSPYQNSTKLHSAMSSGSLALDSIEFAKVHNTDGQYPELNNAIDLHCKFSFSSVTLIYGLQNAYHYDNIPRSLTKLTYYPNSTRIQAYPIEANSIQDILNINISPSDSPSSYQFAVLPELVNMQFHCLKKAFKHISENPSIQRRFYDLETYIAKQQYTEKRQRPKSDLEAYQTLRNAIPEIATCILKHRSPQFDPRTDQPTTGTFTKNINLNLLDGIFVPQNNQILPYTPSGSQVEQTVESPTNRPATPILAISHAPFVQKTTPVIQPQSTVAVAETDIDHGQSQSPTVDLNNVTTLPDASQLPQL